MGAYLELRVHVYTGGAFNGGEQMCGKERRLLTETFTCGEVTFCGARFWGAWCGFVDCGD